MFSIFKKPEAYIKVITKLGTMKVGMTREELTSSGVQENLQNKRARFIEETGTDKAVHLVLVSAAGVVMNPYVGEFQKVITLDDLFADYNEI